MSKRATVVANWKMNGNLELIQSFNQEKWGSENVEVVFALPPTLFAHAQLSALAGQDVSAHENGAFTGELSAPMLREAGCRYVILGHSERRQYHGETEALLLQKWQRAQAAGLNVIYCVGESLHEYEAQSTTEALQRQLLPILEAELLSTNDAIAYEPVWAIGTGKAATADYAQRVHQEIRAMIREKSVNMSRSVRLLYGGSVKADNAASLFACPDVDGFLVGGASLKVVEFKGIIEAVS